MATSRRVDDLELLERWRDGDARAGDRLVRTHFDSVAGFFRNAVGDREGLDLTQETFSQLVEAIARFEGRASFRSFVFGIARHVLLTYFRDKSKQGIFDPLTHTVEDIQGVSPSSVVTEVLSQSALLECIRKLPVDDKQLLELYYWHEMTAGELAPVFEISEATVRTRAHSARTKLRACLGKGEGELDDLDLDQKIVEIAEFLRIGPSTVKPRPS